MNKFIQKELKNLNLKNVNEFRGKGLLNGIEFNNQEKCIKSIGKFKKKWFTNKYYKK